MIIKKFAPVLIPTMNRYDHLKKCLDSLAKNTHASETLLYIALDSPAKEEQKEGYIKIVRYLNNLSGFKEVVIIKRDKNFGVPKNVWQAQDYLFSKYDEIIVSEDDNYFSPNFLDYMNKGLQIFKNRKDIFAICGYNYPIDIPKNYPYNFCLFKGAPGWGIGLWKDKHDDVDISIDSVNRFLGSCRNVLKLNRVAKFLLPHLLDMVNKKIVAGDTIYSMKLVTDDMYCILPTISKVRNCGNDGTGEHCGIDKENVFASQTIDNAKYFDFSTPINGVHENKELTKLMQKSLSVPNVEVFKRWILYITRNTNLHKYYKRLEEAKLNISEARVVIFKKIIQHFYSKLIENYRFGKKMYIYSAMYIIWKKYFKKFNPEVKVKIGKKYLFMNLDHQLPFYYYKYPNYDRALPRMCKKLKVIDKKLSVIDIGANIGDTVSLITDMTKGNFLCVEGDDKYLPILKKNVKQMSTGNNISIEECYCGSETNEKAFILRTNGTAKIVRHKPINIREVKSQILKIKSLDRIIRDNPNFKDSNLLKIDTDGFEIEVLNSGKTFIKKTKPLIYFEFIPELYKRNNQNQNMIWSFLKECGYNEALFYDNFGGAIEIVDIYNRRKVSELIKRIDDKNINYYDVLTCHKSNIRHSEILKSELKMFVRD